ncbi:butanoate--CoA ligase AAE1-like isoform X1 [Primulina huaijiensis]|uniref:butanoate--CoA ligase AAE1-like isoform X1 n=2 Tax=Primulina huaijiensis TaxID=1492673 RepID=UPI003CC77770
MNLFLRRRISHLMSRRIFFNGVTSIVHSSGNNYSRNLCELTTNLEDLSRKKFEGLVKCPVNYVPLTPISFLERAARVYGDRTSVVCGSYKCSWEETHLRCVKLASAMTQLGISRFDVVINFCVHLWNHELEQVATLAPNVPAMQELHFAVPMAGAILCTLNTRHDSTMISALLHHSETKIIFVYHQLLRIAQQALHTLTSEYKIKPPILVIIPERDNPSPSYDIPDIHEYESFLASGDGEFVARRPETEWDPISINYTSGTTSRPKGVVYNHRGAYINALATTSMHGMGSMPVYLWTVPMFHCNGWCLIWGLAALGGTNICLRQVKPKEIFNSIVLHHVTHMSGAPTVLNMIINSSDQKQLPHKVNIMTGGAAPPPSILSKIEELGFRVSHLYGLTEVYGPGTSCMWKPEWDSLPPEERFRFKARQGVEHFGLEEVDVKDPTTMKSVPKDGATMGEIMFRGNTVMSGYLKDLKATQEAFAGGWFRSGDLGVKHEDGYIEVKDRSKDIVISGGENISSIEVETVLYRHPAVLEAAVVARPDNHWGQTPCAFVKLKDGFDVDPQDVMNFCRDHLPHYMAPRTVVIGDLPRTSTGKVQKYILREKARALGSLA